MDHGQTDVATLAAELATAGAVAARLGLLRDSDAWHLTALRVDAGPDAAVPERRWDYDQLVLLSGLVDGAEAASWLTGASGSMLGTNFAIDSVQPSLSWTAHPSRSRGLLDPLQWPCIEYSLYFPVTLQLPGGFSIGTDCPSFDTAPAALGQFLYGPEANQGNAGEGRVRIGYPEARIDQVHISATALTVSVGGAQRAGVRAELLASGDDHQALGVGEDGEVQFILPSGIPSRAILLLSRDRRWLDYRHLDPVYRMSRPDFSVEEELSEQIEALISTGEGSTLEFKVIVPAPGADSRKVMKTVAAFANGDGGTIIFGVDDDDHIPVGIADVTTTRDRLTNMVRSTLVPQPVFDVEIAHVQGKDLLVLTVVPGAHPPYGIDPKNPHYYVRRSGSTYPAEPQELRAIVQARSVNAAASWLSPRL